MSDDDHGAAAARGGSAPGDPPAGPGSAPLEARAAAPAPAGAPPAAPVGGPSSAPYSAAGDTSRGAAGDGSTGDDTLAGPVGHTPEGEGLLGRLRRRSPGPAQRRGGFLRELPFLVVVAFALALLIKAFLVQAFYIPSGSMQQTLAIRDRVLVNKLVYRFRDVHRGEIIVFNGAGSFSNDPDQEVFQTPTNPVSKVLRSVGGAIGLGAPGEKDFIKRVIGVPGDRVACCSNGHVTVQPAGGGPPIELSEPYTYENDAPLVFCAAGKDEVSCPVGAPGVLVPAGRLFVMGDHRCCSSDSRLHLDDGEMGTVPESEVIGRAFVVVWPLDHLTLLKVPGVFGSPGLALPAGTAGAVPYALGAVAALPVSLLGRRGRRGRRDRWGGRDRWGHRRARQR